MDVGVFSERILRWHDVHGRKDLPWQQQVTSYRVWVSEIMLQQTQVDTVIPYFERFIARFPNIDALAGAPIDEVLHLWSGLGYYARGRHLHAAARIIGERYGGELPADFESLRALPGIGRSTAGAILALACGQRYPILDGNVKRVLTRHRCIEGWPGRPHTEAELWEWAEALTPERRVPQYSQAMMDLGALLCTRRDPDCEHCPVSSDCTALGSNRQHELPALKPRKTLPVRDTVMLMVCNSDSGVLLQRRPPAGIWGGLWSFPELADKSDVADWCERVLGVMPIEIIGWPGLRHTFSHFHLRITPLQVRVQSVGDSVMEGEEWVWYKVNSLRGGLAAPVNKLLRQLTENDREL